MKTLQQVTAEALQILNAHEEAADLDAGFDGGEFSGPAHSRLADKEIEELATSNGYTFEQVQDEIDRGF